MTKKDITHPCVVYMKLTSKLSSQCFLFPLLFVSGVVFGVLVVIVALQFIVKPPVTKIINGPPDAANVPPPLTGIPTPPVEESASSSPGIAIDVDWNSQPKKVDPNVIFANLNHDPSVPSPIPFPEGSIGLTANFVFWEKGVVRGTKNLGGYKVYAMMYDEQGLGTTREKTLIFISPNGDRVYSQRGMEDKTWLSTYFFTLDVKYSVKLNAPPSESVLQNGAKIVLTSEFSGVVPDPSCTREGCPGRIKVASTTDGWNLYSSTLTDVNFSDPIGCLLVFGPDGTGYRYASLIPSKREDLKGTSAEGIESAISADRVTWKVANSNLKGYYLPYEMSGCGFHGCAEIVSDTELQGALTLGGKAPNGDDVYIAKDPANLKQVKEMYESWIGYDRATGEKPSFEEFINKHPIPVFFWRDALGRWVQYSVMDVQPQVECGKPVIYLYPEKVTNVSVRLPSFINVTESEPTYPVSGWNVTASPDGQLVMRDGARFGSLYWEGTGVGYKAPKDGFILKDGEVDSRLAEILKQYGLNQTESREFREFWVPKMTGAPYYRVSFLTSAWSKAAPLYVSPAPATSIRIFMDWQKLKAPISIPEPKIETPVRRGFTLVEWGGLLMK